MNTQNSVEIHFRIHRTQRKSFNSEPTASPVSRPGVLPRVTQVLALAIQFQDMLNRGEASNYADLARLGCLTRERMSQIMELVWLAPDIQEEILGFPPDATGRFPVTEVAVRRIGGFLCWEKQRTEWRALKDKMHI